jgi:hypothetical protein
MQGKKFQKNCMIRSNLKWLIGLYLTPSIISKWRIDVFAAVSPRREVKPLTNSPNNTFAEDEINADFMSGALKMQSQNGHQRPEPSIEVETKAVTGRKQMNCLRPAGFSGQPVLRPAFSRMSHYS